MDLSPVLREKEMFHYIASRRELLNVHTPAKPCCSIKKKSISKVLPLSQIFTLLIKGSKRGLQSVSKGFQGVSDFSFASDPWEPLGDPGHGHGIRSCLIDRYDKQNLHASQSGSYRA